MSSSIKLEPYKYVHIRDSNTLITRLETGPQTFFLLDHEELVTGITPMVKLPPKHFIIISNPVALDKESKKPLKDSHGSFRVRNGHNEVRTNEQYPEPFPLYPGEEIKQAMTQYLILKKEEARLMKVVEDFTEEATGTTRKAGTRFHIYGPCTYIPRPEAVEVGPVKKEVLGANTSIRLSAVRAFTDRTGTAREAGEEYMFSGQGSFLPDVNEKVLSVIEGTVLTDKKALRVSAQQDFVDASGVTRIAGSHWNVTNADTKVFTPGVYERIEAEITPVTLTNREYCLIKNPREDGRTAWGITKVVVGEKTFFLEPNEANLGVHEVMILSEDMALDMLARESFFDKDANIHRFAGESWVIRGPREYIPPVEAEVVRRQDAQALDQNEGLYIRDLNTGEVKAVIGETVLLSANEALWDKELSPELEHLIYRGGQRPARSKVVTYPAADNTAVQIHDFRSGATRVVFGPELIMLGPYEAITVLNVSGGVPMRENSAQLLCLPLGQNNFEDEISVETNDHASMSVRLSYSAHFRVTDELRANEPGRLFSIPDYVGIACKTIASRIRGTVSSISYEEFHHSYSAIIKKAVFGSGEEFFFAENSFVITECDVKSQQLTDENIRDMLKKNTSLAISLKTRANELKYELQRKLLEEESNGQLVLQKLEDQKKAASAEIELQKLKVASDAVETVGEKLAGAKAKAEGREIEGASLVAQAEYAVSAYQIETESLVMERRAEHEREIEEKEEEARFQVEKAEKLANIEVEKFQKMVKAIGANTIAEMAKAGPESRAELLKALNIEGYLVTDGTTPVNLFKAAEGFVRR